MNIATLKNNADLTLYVCSKMAKLFKKNRNILLFHKKYQTVYGKQNH